MSCSDLMYRRELESSSRNSGTPDATGRNRIDSPVRGRKHLSAPSKTGDRKRVSVPADSETDGRDRDMSRNDR